MHKYIPSLDSCKQLIIIISSSECQIIDKTATTGTLHSPKISSNVPNYPRNTNCTWEFENLSVPGYYLEFTLFDLEDSPNCENDYLMVIISILFLHSQSDI